MRYLPLVFATAGLCFLTACSSPPVATSSAEVVLPLNHAWVDGNKVGYVTTDISDAAMAQDAGVNYVPRLSKAAAQTGNNSLLERVYKFPNGEQITIFQSAPRPTGAANIVSEYSPLWRMALVRWVKPERVRELKSEAELLSAEDAGEVSIQVTQIVVNCPVVRGADGQALQGVR